MKQQLSKRSEYFLRDQLPIGFFLSGNEEENLRYVFDAPELIKRGSGPMPVRERHLVVKPLIVTGLVLAGVLAGLWQGIGGA